MPEQGYIHLYCGGGKGKTTAATGLAIRALGQHFKVLFCQFLKNNQTGELEILKQLEGITLLLENPVTKFTRSMSEEELSATRIEQRAKFLHALECLQQESYDLVIFDEIMAALHTGCLSVSEVADFLKNRPQTLEVVLTGRNPPPELRELADYVSEIQAQKHPYSQGVAARRGIEY